MNVSLRASLVLGALTLGGCATIVSGGKQELTFDSSPQGATIEVNGADMGRTPGKVTVPRKTTKEVQIKKSGYKPATVPLETSLDPWFWGNIVTGGLYGTTTDGMSGNINRFDPDSYFVSLEPEAGPPRKIGAVYTDPNDPARVKQYILMSYAPLAANINAGTGPYLESLFDQLRVPPSQRATAFKDLYGLFVQHPDSVAFADATLRRFLQTVP